jgi:signal transduction histidine kinase
MAELPSNRAVDCLRLSHNGRVYGQLILYRANEHGISDRQRMLLTALSSEISLALESRRLRAREMATFAYLQEARLFTDFDSRLAALLARVVEILDSEGGVLLRTDSHTSELEVQVEAGRELGAALSLVYGLALGAQGESKPLMIGDLKQEGAENAGLRSALIAPLFNEGGSLGVLVIWSGHPHRFSRHHVRLVTMLAGQLSLLLDNYRLYLQVESQAVLAERARLAREIHDGLAQVLGYLKLRLAQSELWLREGRTDRALDGLAEANRLAADAYVDTREAIDGLRLRPDDATLERWVEQVAGDFESLSGISVSSSAIPDVDLPMEVQVQLIRLVQEALSNVRKHAGADQARLEWKRMEAGLMVEIVDNGQGFDAIDVPPIAQHGLRIMRERAEMLDAEFQVTSRPGEGTRVSVLIPERWFDGGGHYATAD